MIFFNDKKIYNLRYRNLLMRDIGALGLKVKSVGVVESYSSLAKAFFILLFTAEAFISSNMKSNLFCSLFFWKRGTLIINGLGRNKGKKYFRAFLFFLFNINSNKTIIFQNYFDYRYFSSLSKRSYFWVPGSGGTKRDVGESSSITIVSREDKVEACSASILQIANSLSLNEKIFIVGCSDNKVSSIFKHESIIGIGYIDQDDIFKLSSTFYQPSGYGEGIPHTLVDAVCSNMKILICKKDYISYGLYKLGFSFKSKCGDNGLLVYTSDEACKLSSEIVNKKYLNVHFNEGK